MGSRETVKLEVSGGAARVVLNRPDSLNSWNEQFGRELLEVVREVSADDAVRAVMITGAGRAFSSGADLKEQRSGDDGLPDLSQRLKEIYHPIILGIREMPKPVIAAVNGPAVGIGCSLALDCDLVLAAESAYFLLAFVNIGLVPRRRLDGAAAGPSRSREVGRDGDAGRARPGRAGLGVGDRQPRPRRRPADRGLGADAAASGRRPYQGLRELQDS